MHDLDNLGRAFELADMGGMIKIEQTQYTHQAMRAIGSGFQSVLFADIRIGRGRQAGGRRGARRDDDGQAARAAAAGSASACGATSASCGTAARRPMSMR